MNKKRIFIIAAIHFVVSFTVTLFPSILIPPSLEPDPLWFRILLIVINLPLTIPAIYIIGLGKGLSIYTMLGILVLVAAPLNSFIWGLIVSKIICLINKKRLSSNNSIQRT